MDRFSTPLTDTIRSLDRLGQHVFHLCRPLFELSQHSLIKLPLCDCGSARTQPIIGFLSQLPLKSNDLKP
jgi:hypothetical protein